MAFHSVSYQRMRSSSDDVEEDLPPTYVTTRGADDKGSWTHIENLDDFFTRVYEYHQQHGFFCMMLSESLELVQYVFIVVFTTFLVVCVNYKKLFEDKNPVFSEVTNFENVKKMSSGLVVCLAVACLFWLIRLGRIVKHLIKAWQIGQFYKYALSIRDNDLQNMQWSDVQCRLKDAQRVFHMCIHKGELTELDTYHRILRRKNYLIALQNKGIISCIYKFPLLGHRTFVTEGLKYNLKLILFSGPGALFEQNWRLKPAYKEHGNRQWLTKKLSREIFLLGVANLLLCPFILVYQVLYSFFRYAELIKRSPDTFGARRWSPYGRLYVRHFNELDHEFEARLNKAYDPAKKYMDSFVSPLLAVLAKNVAFFAGAILAVLLGLSFYDQDVLTAEHVISFMATLGLIIKGCSAFIPDENNTAFCPNQLMKQILAHVHYLPKHWKGKAHSLEVQNQFSRLFQYKIVYLLEELLSPVLTPFILCFSWRYKASDIVDFFRNFTVEVTGVGDVCSFAQLDVRKHGNPEWLSDGLTEAGQYERAENGKTELSLLHFSIKNPTWKPTESGERFITAIKEQASRESLTMSASVQHPSNTWGQGQGLETHPDLTTFIGPIHYPSMDPMTFAQRNDMMLSTSMLFMHEQSGRQSLAGRSTTSHDQSRLVSGGWHREDSSEELHDTVEIQDDPELMGSAEG